MKPLTEAWTAVTRRADLWLALLICGVALGPTFVIPPEQPAPVEQRPLS